MANMACVNLGIRLSLYDFQRMRIDDIDFNTQVKQLKIEVSKKANVPKENFELVYCGNILDDEATLASCGMRSGVMIHVLKKKAKEIPKAAQNMSEIDIQSLYHLFLSLSANPSYRSNLQKLSRQDILDNIILITPGLIQDPVAISLIQNPEVLLRVVDLDSIRRIVKLHPALAEAANHIVAAVHEMSAAAPPSTQPTTSTGYSYSLDALSDEDDSSESESQLSGARHAITAAQLASALASANSPSPGMSQDSSGITPEMFSQAMERAIASVVGQPSSREAAENPQAPTQLAQQMQQMRELGLTDDAVNLQALQIAQGNVHAAIELVFSGAISPAP